MIYEPFPLKKEREALQTSILFRNTNKEIVSSTMYEWLKHAFSTGSSGAATPTAVQAKLIDRVCREIVRRQMTLPAQMFVESSAPLHFVGGQLMRFLEPFISVVLDPNEVRDFASFIEQRGSMEYISTRLEEIERRAAEEKL